MARRDSARLTSSHRIRSSLLELAAAAALALGPASGQAASLSEVRVGTHSDHTRIVLQLDSAADYRIVSSGKDELVVALDAQSVTRKVASKSPLVRGVRVEASGAGSTVHVALARRDVQVTEMILANPPRIVFDLARGESAPSTADVMMQPKPEAVAAKPVEATKPVLVADAHPTEAASAQLPAKSAPSEAPVVAAADPPTAPSGSDPKPAEASPPPEPAKLVDAGHPAAPPAMPAPPPAVEPAETAPAALPSHRQAPAPGNSSDSASSWLIGTLMSPTGLVVVGAGLIAGLAMVVMRRRAAADDDPLYSVMSAEDAGGEADEASMPGASWGERPERSAEQDARGFEAESEASYEELPLSRLGSAGTPAGTAGRANGSIFDAESSPAAGGTGSSSGAANLGGALHADALRAAADLESRIGDLERRLEQLGEARERLERQVAAQTEELRVQRAAIARTQRVVRSMTKGDDLVTEPVPRSPNA